jgi:glycosyltransferase involved in cell wall biosynthesis
MVIDTFNRANGGTIATMRLVEGLRKRGHTFNIVASRSDEPDFFEVPGFYLPGTRESQEKMNFPFGVPDKKVLREAFEDADLVQVQFPFFLGYGAAKLARAMGKPLLGGFHVQPQNIISAMGKESPFLEWMIFRIFNFFLFNRAPVVHCPSRFAAKMLKQNGVRSRLRVVSNGIPTEIKAKSYPRPEEFGDNLVLINIGRHALEKRQMLILDAVKHSRYADKITLMLFGRGEMSDALIAGGKDMPRKPVIRYASEEEKLLYLNTADLYVHASIVELESLSCLEAVGCGLPCLVANSPHSAAVQFAPDKRFIFNKDDRAQLIERIEYWYEHRQELRAIREKVLTMADQYLFERCIDQMDALYKKMANKEPISDLIPEPEVI